MSNIITFTGKSWDEPVLEVERFNDAVEFEVSDNMAQNILIALNKQQIKELNEFLKDWLNDATA